VAGYEIHMGQSASDSASAPFSVEERSRTPSEDLDGCVSADGDVLGTYIHGLFHNEGLRRAILSELAARKGLPLQLGGQVVSKEEQYDRLAALVRANLDMDLVYAIAGLERKK
ncbi:MAG: cobyric acid synthase CobQ, partial [Dehalococcoidales bacterium]|nr:cobyric acid synthase CobQ [Dehalococcoidales bacterium]